VSYLAEIVSNLRVVILDGGASLLPRIGSTGLSLLFSMDLMHASNNAPIANTKAFHTSHPKTLRQFDVIADNNCLEEVNL
jgi:hypothetical protein